MFKISIGLLIALGLQAAPLIIISVDGLDNRYLRDRDALSMKIPNMRRLLQEGAWAENGVAGVMPSITWPSHTSIITGVRPDQHGILGNWRPTPDGKNEKWLSADQIKVPTLIDAAHRQGLKIATVDWPVTVGARSDWNLPEYFLHRNGSGMDLDSIEKKSTPGLVEKLGAALPSFATQWMDDRTRALATVYLIEHEHPDLVLLHLVDHDADAHEVGPYTRGAKAILEYTDELIGSIVKAASDKYVVALVSDHGFQRVDKVLNVPVLLRQEGVNGDVRLLGGGLAVTRDPSAAAVLRKNSREIPASEVERYMPALAGSILFEPPDHVEFGSGSEDLNTKPREVGNHGFWPARHDYRSVFVLWGGGIRREKLGELQMLDLAQRLAGAAGIRWPVSNK
jgi:predicted AlkP superfamily pyrophosphatase or phosphodiesterase